MNFRISINSVFLLLSFNFFSFGAFGFGTPNTPGRPEPVQAPGAFEKPFNSIPTTKPRTDIKTETPRALATPKDLKDQTAPPISVILKPAMGSHASGNVIFIQKQNNVVIKGNVAGLKPGWHGIHIHEKGDCSDIGNNFQKAGPHFNPKKVKHGSLEHGHVGDLGNIKVGKDGRSTFALQTSKLSIIPGNRNSIFGRSIMIHAGKDDEKTNPAGNSGKRILCGVIK